MDKLRECPFCGNKNITIEQSTFSYGHEYDDIWLIKCKATYFANLVFGQWIRGDKYEMGN